MVKPSLNINVFKSLDMEQQVEEVNKLIASGQSITDIAKSIGLNESSIRKRFNKNGYTRSKDGAKLFELSTEAIPTKEILEQKLDKEIKVENNDNNDFIIDVDIINRLIALEEEIKDVKEELKVVKEQSINLNDKINEAYSDMNTLQPKDFKSDLKQISYRYNIEVLDKLNKLCAMYPHISKTRILNTLIDESMDRYLK